MAATAVTPIGVGASERTPPRAPGLVQVAIAVVVCVALAAFTLTARQTPPPTIAEFAPQAVQQLKEAPSEQAGAIGAGGGASDSSTPPPDDSEGDATSATSVPVDGAEAIDGPRVRRCVGQPPRQTEDPQSPPCVPFFKGDNGGATAVGVTADTIFIANPLGPQGAARYQATQDEGEVARALVNHFNSRYEMYGRKMKLLPFEAQPGQGGPNRPAQRAAADKAKELKTFASTSLVLSPGFYDGLVQNKIVGAYRTPDYTDSFLAKSSPYLYGYQMSPSQIMANLAEWGCSRLVGGTAEYGGVDGTKVLGQQKRKFSILLQLPDEAAPVRAKPLKDALEACGAEVVHVHEDFMARTPNNPSLVQNEVTKMRQAGVTTVFGLYEAQHLEKFQIVSQAQGYEPEWVISSYPQAYSGYYSSRSREQVKRMFGVMFQPMERVPEDHPSIWAFQEGSGGARYDRDSLNMAVQDIAYRDLLLLASGIQLAGPKLTPETFRDGLLRARFPNPASPITAGQVGFTGDFSMVNDGIEVWWDNDAVGPYPDMKSGALCYASGARYAKGQWPKGRGPFFDKSKCDTGSTPVG